MTAVTRQEVLGLYRKIFRIARKWQSTSGQAEETAAEREYIIKEAKTLFRKNTDVTDPKLIKQCIEECEARIEIGLHYNIPYPRPESNPAVIVERSSGDCHYVSSFTAQWIAEKDDPSASHGSYPETMPYISTPGKVEEDF